MDAAGRAQRPIGCPTGPFVTDADGGYVQFEHGQVAVSPSVWEQGVVAAYQDGNGIFVDWTVSWTSPSHYNYSKFVVRWDYNGQHFDDVDRKPCQRGDGDQCDVLADMTEVQAVLLHYFADTHLRTKGTFALPVDHGPGDYGIAIEGCDEGAVGGSTCRQGWLHAVRVNLQPPPPGVADFPIDLTSVPTSFDAASSRGNFAGRAAAITLYNACRVLPYSVYRNEESYMTIILAKLDYANYYQQDTCPGWPVANRQEAIDSLAQQSVGTQAGTTIDSCPGCRTGDYDVALSGYIPILYRFGSLLPVSVYDHILNDLLNKRGPHTGEDDSVSVNVPETENHINMIESARYLTRPPLRTHA